LYPFCRQGKGTAFEAAGLRIGQTIISVDGRPMQGEDLRPFFFFLETFADLSLLLQNKALLYRVGHISLVHSPPPLFILERFFSISLHFTASMLRSPLSPSDIETSDSIFGLGVGDLVCVFRAPAKDK
jgi:hypothetical protein